MGGGRTVPIVPFCNFNCIQILKNVEEFYPLSPVQESILYHSLIEESECLYVAQLSFKLEEAIQLDVLKAAFQRLVESNPALRTHYVWEKLKKPIQVIQKNVSLPWAELELNQVSIGDELRAIKDGEMASVRDLSLKPPMRLALVKIEEGVYEFIWSFHQILFDGWSLSILLSQLFNEYQQLCLGNEVPLQVRESTKPFVKWALNTEHTLSDSFWKRYLSGHQCEHVLHRSAKRSENKGTLQRIQWEFSSEVSEAITQEVQKVGITPGSFFRGAWALFLAEHTGLTDFCWGQPTSGRTVPLSGIEEQIGFFVNTLPVRVKIDESSFVLDWFRHIQGEQFEAQKYEHTPLSHIIRLLEVESEKGLFEHLFVFENYPRKIKLEDIAKHIRLTNLESVESTHYSLSVAVIPGECFRVDIAYQSGQVDPDLVANLEEGLKKIISVLLESMNLRLGNLLKRGNRTNSFDRLPSIENRKYTFVPKEGAGILNGQIVHGPQYEAFQGEWKAVLGVEKVEADDDFFAQGGTSILAMQFALRLKKVLNENLPIDLVFKYKYCGAIFREFMRKRAHDGSGGESVSIVAKGDRKTYKASYSQQSFWFLEKLEGTRETYNIPGVIEIQGALSVSSLKKSLEQILFRHDVLRSHIGVRDGSPWVVVSDDCEASLEIVDYRGADPGESLVKRLMEKEAFKPFDIEREPPIRFCLCRLEEERSYLIVTMHHIGADGWSLSIFLRDLADSYHRYSQGRCGKLTKLPVGYGDYADHIRQGFENGVYQELLAYWKNRFEILPPPLNLKTDYPRSNRLSYRGDNVQYKIAGISLRKLDDYCQRKNITQYMFLLAVYQYVLSRYTREGDVVVGVPFANRSYPEVEGIVGPFFNTLPLRTKVESQSTFAEYLEKVREVCVDAYKYQAVPFEKLIEVINPERDLSHQTLFQTMFIFEIEPEKTIPVAGLEFIPHSIPYGRAKYDLSLVGRRQNKSLELTINYNKDLFQHKTMERFLERFHTIVQNVLADDAVPLKELSWDSAQQLENWKKNFYISHRSIAQDALKFFSSFEEIVENKPDKVAVFCGSEQLTFRELELRSNQVANSLIEQGLQREDRVGVILTHSIELLVASMGILKAGCVYVPIPFSVPEKRRLWIQKDAGLKVIIGMQEHAPAVTDKACVWMVLEKGYSDFAEYSNSWKPKRIHPLQLAYIIYTSGTTGNPKGVLGTYGALFNRFQWMWKEFPFEEGEVCLQKSSLAFVDSLWELWGGILQGVPTVFYQDKGPFDLGSLVDCIEHFRVSRIVLVPSLLRAILQYISEHARSLTSLKLVISSGETLPNSLVGTFQELIPYCQLLNLYGSSEVAADVTYFDVGESAQMLNCPVGYSIENVHTYVLNACLQLEIEDVVGEVYCSGEGLARGYQNNPRQTAENFLPSVFPPEQQGTRMYRMRDLGRSVGTCGLVLEGRSDSQVKIRGHRIELGEIEKVLNGHPLIKQVVAKAEFNQLNEAFIVAYLVSERQEMNLLAKIRAFMQEHVPQYMIPSQFIHLEVMPLTQSGKVDRKQLQASAGEVLCVEQEEVIPCDMQVSRELEDIWKTLLQVKEVKKNDDFFQLGGHSLLAIRFVARIRKTFGVEISLNELFEYSEFHAMAHLIEKAFNGGATDCENVKIKISERSHEVGFAQERIWYNHQLAPASGHYNIPAAISIDGKLDIKVLEAAFIELIQRHEVLRSNYSVRDDRLVQGVSAGTSFKLDVVDMRGGLEKEFSEILAGESVRPFDLEKDSLIRVKLCREADERYQLILVIHHIAFDGWSFPIFIRELSYFYGSISQGEKSVLPDLPFQYSGYAEWQKKMWEQGGFDASLTHWKQYLSGYVPLEWPLDRERGIVASSRGDVINHQLDREQMKALKALGEEHQATLFMTLYAVMQVLLHRKTGQRDLLTGTVVANRSHEEFEGLIGCFVNALVIRIRCEETDSFEILLRKLREECLQAFEHQAVPFDKVVSDLGKSFEGNKHPLFQILFAMQNRTDVELEVDQLKFGDVFIKGETSKFDIRLFAREESGGIALEVAYNCDIFQRASMERFMQSYVYLLEQIIAQPSAPLEQLELKKQVKIRRMGIKP